MSDKSSLSPDRRQQDAVEFGVVCVHATRQTRRDAPPGIAERPCAGCRATILVSPAVLEYAAAYRLELVYHCPRCAIANSEPDQVPDHVVPGTIETLAAAGVDQPERLVADSQARTIHDLAYTALRNSVGGQG